MKIIFVPVIVFATIFVVSLSAMKAIRTKNKESISVFGIDGLISLWMTTLVFLVFTFIGWFSAPNIKYEIIKYISYASFLITSTLHIAYIRANKRRIQQRNN